MRRANLVRVVCAVHGRERQAIGTCTSRVPACPVTCRACNAHSHLAHDVVERSREAGVHRRDFRGSAKRSTIFLFAPTAGAHLPWRLRTAFLDALPHCPHTAGAASQSPTLLAYRGRPFSRCHPHIFGQQAWNSLAASGIRLRKNLSLLRAISILKWLCGRPGNPLRPGFRSRHRAQLPTTRSHGPFPWSDVP
jgi:hypothetical protein